MTTPSSVPKEIPIAVYVGLDWADQQHVVCWQAAGSSQVETATVRQRPEPLQAWVAQLRSRFPEGVIAIALEQSRGPVIAALMHYDFLRLYPINPKSLARYREAFSSSGAKDDPNDAALLLDLLVKHRDRFSPWIPDDALSRQLALRVEHRRQLVDLKTSLTHQLSSQLKLYFPQALDWAGELDSLQACDFLQRWPTLQAVQKARTTQLEKFYTRHNCRRPQLIQQRIEQIGQAQPLTHDIALVAAGSAMVLALVALVRDLICRLQQWQQEISQLFIQHPDQTVFASFPAAGPVFAPRLQAAFGSGAIASPRPKRSCSFPAWPRSLNAAANPARSIDVGRARNSCIRALSNLLPFLYRTAAGPGPFTSSCERAAIDTGPPFAWSLSNGFVSSFVVGKTGFLMTNKSI